jgi:hypothetical protein
MFLLKEEGSVTRAAWPDVSGLDENEMMKADYLEDVMDSFRDKRAKANKKNKGKKTVTEKGVVYVQTTYPVWRQKLLNFLKAKWDDEKKAFGVEKKELIKEVGALQKGDEDLKAQGKMLNKVLAFVMQAAEKRGKSALECEWPFDEAAVLTEFSKFIAAEMSLPKGLEIIVNSTEEVASNAEPGKPALVEL